MANAERNQHAPELAASSRLNHAQHVAYAIRPLATSAVTEAPHAIKPIELFSGQAIEIAESADDTTLHQLGKQLFADTL
jgi:threonine dehydratase